MKLPVSLYTSYNMAKVQSLVNSGATNNFIHPQLVQQMGFGMRPLPMPKTLYNVDNTTNKAGKITHYLDLDVYTNKIHKTMHFLVTDIGKEDVLFGYPWLAAFHPEFDWRGGRIYNQYLPIEIQSIKPSHSSLPSIAALQVEDKLQIITQLEEDCHIHTLTTDLAIEVNSNQKEVHLPDKYQSYASVFSKEELQCFPPKHSWDHAIDFKPGVPNTIDCHVYPMTKKEDEDLDAFIDQQLAKGYICPSISPYASSFFFIKKKDSKLRPVQDYCNINKWTVHNQYPLLLIISLICDLGGTHIFSKLDIHWGYNNVCIREGDKHKAAFKMRHGLYEPMVMFFRLTNSPVS